MGWARESSWIRDAKTDGCNLYHCCFFFTRISCCSQPELDAYAILLKYALQIMITPRPPDVTLELRLVYYPTARRPAHSLAYINNAHRALPSAATLLSPMESTSASPAAPKTARPTTQRAAAPAMASRQAT